MTPNQTITQIRSWLDDPVGLPNKNRPFWLPEDIVQQLDASQLEIVQMMHSLGHRYLLNKLLTPLSVSITQNNFRVALPTDYLLPAVCTINGKAATLNALRQAVVGQMMDALYANIEGRDVVFTGVTQGSALFYYYKLPESFALNQDIQRRQFPERMYQAILHHAAAMLAQKDAGNTRFQKGLRSALMRLTSTQPGMNQVYEDYVA